MNKTNKKRMIFIQFIDYVFISSSKEMCFEFYSLHSKSSLYLTIIIIVVCDCNQQCWHMWNKSMNIKSIAKTTKKTSSNSRKLQELKSQQLRATATTTMSIKTAVKGNRRSYFNILPHPFNSNRFSAWRTKRSVSTKWAK